MNAYEPQGIRFHDATSGRTMLLVTEVGAHEGWLCWLHPDGGWVTLRKATDAERDLIRARHREAIMSGQAPIRCVTPDGRHFNVRVRPASPPSAAKDEEPSHG